MSKDENKANFLMKYGSDAHQEKVLNRRVKATSLTRWSTAVGNFRNQGEEKYKRHLDILVKDKDSEVRSAVACNGHKDHLDKLVNDKDDMVRLKVAHFGDDSHREKLLNDHSSMVRSTIAHKSEHKGHLSKLTTDSEEVVSRAAKNNLKRLEQTGRRWG